MKPEEILQEAAKTFEERGRVYGESYLNYGKIMAAIFPDGITIKGEEAFNRFALFFHCVNKIQRYSQNLEKGGHQDSAHDLCVYAAMLESQTCWL
jgi:hypothetical protein